MKKADGDKLKLHHAKILNDLIVEFAFYHSKETTDEGREQFFKMYNEMWIEHCIKQKGNKAILLKHVAFKTIAGDNKVLNSIKKKLGIPEYHPQIFSLLKRMFA